MNFRTISWLVTCAIVFTLLVSTCTCARQPSSYQRNLRRTNSSSSGSTGQNPGTLNSDTFSQLVSEARRNLSPQRNRPSIPIRRSSGVDTNPYGNRPKGVSKIQLQKILAKISRANGPSPPPALTDQSSTQPTKKELQKEIKNRITPQTAKIVVGLGGTYSYLSRTFSKSIDEKTNLIEADHFPPQDTYSNSKPKFGQMAAITLPAQVHRDFVTTGSSHRAQDARKKIADKIRANDFKGALQENLGFYARGERNDDEKTPLNTFNAKIRKGLAQVMIVHQNQGHISRKERKSLQKEIKRLAYEKKHPPQNSNQEKQTTTKPTTEPKTKPTTKVTIKPIHTTKSTTKQTTKKPDRRRA